MEGTVERRKSMNRGAREEESKSGKRGVEREKEKTMVKRRCVNPFSTNNLRKVFEGVGFPCDDSCGGSCSSSVCVLVGLLGATDVQVSSLSVGVLGEDSYSGF